MQSIECRLFDFDRTLNISHSFQKYKLLAPAQEDRLKQYQIGKTAAEGNIKIGVENILKHNNNDLAGIVTHHNNPAFIAGFLSEIFGEELVYIETQSSKDSDSAIDSWKIPEIKEPFLISWCNKFDQEHTQFMETWPGKNKQIQALRTRWLETKRIDSNTPIHFYDDCPENIRASTHLDYVISHQIEAENPVFTEVYKMSPQPLIRIEPNFGINLSAGYEEEVVDRRETFDTMIYTRFGQLSMFYTDSSSVETSDEASNLNPLPK